MPAARRTVVAVLILVTAAAGSSLLFGAAGAQEPGTLTGETLLAGPTVMASSYTTDARCQLSGESTITFSATGAAAGAYAGTFTETGTATIGPQTVVGFPVGPLVSFESTFRIDAGPTTITGTKSLVAPSGTGTCITPEQPGGAAPQYFMSFEGATVEYSATVEGPLGTWTEKGTATVSGIEVRSSGSTQPASGSFGEVFLTALRSGHPQPATLTLTPAAAVNTVDDSHTVTASVATESGQPVGGVVVRFSVTGSVTTTGSCTTDASGQCTFTYMGPALPGSDVITAYADSDGDQTQDPGEPTAVATKSWVLPVSTPGHVTGGGQISMLGRDVTFGFEAISTGERLEGECTVVDLTTGTTIKCRTVTALVQTPTHATFFGTGTQDDQEITYRIDVDDLGEPGLGTDTFKIQTDGGYVAGGPVTEGDVQIHPV